MSNLVEENIIKKLCEFNLSPTQAKIYAFLAETGRSQTNIISDATHIYAQDIYKALDALQKKGLVFKSSGKPVTWEAAPIAEGLKHRITSLDKEYRQKIKTLKSYYKEIGTKLKQKTESKPAYTIFFFPKKVPISKIDFAFKKLKTEYSKVLVDSTYPRQWLDYEKLQYLKAAKRNVRIRTLILTKQDESVLADIFEKIMPKNGQFEIRTLKTEEEYWFVVIDSRELWLPMFSTGNLNLIVADAPEIVKIAKAQFENLWNAPNAVITAKGPSQ